MKWIFIWLAGIVVLFYGPMSFQQVIYITLFPIWAAGQFTRSKSLAIERLHRPVYSQSSLQLAAFLCLFSHFFFWFCFCLLHHRVLSSSTLLKTNCANPSHLHSFGIKGCIYLISLIWSWWLLTLVSLTVLCQTSELFHLQRRTFNEYVLCVGLNCGICSKALSMLASWRSQAIIFFTLFAC